MGSSSRELLHLEHKNHSSIASLQSALRVCDKKESESLSKKPPSLDGKPFTSSVPKSQFLGKVQDFLGVISEANKQLEQDAQENSQNHDIEALTGNESNVIELDLMLGIADLHTPEAIAAAESAMTNGQPLIDLDSDSSEAESGSESTSDDDDSDDNDNKPSSSLKHKKLNLGGGGSHRTSQKNQPSKRPKVVEM